MIKRLLLKVILFYKKIVSPSLASRCRFYPSCSEYCYLAIEKHGLAKGLLLGTKRILRCHPLNSGGVDLP